MEVYRGWPTHKWGGSSLTSLSCWQRLSKVVDNQKVIIVVSAIGHTTKQLQALWDAAQRGDDYRSARALFLGDVQQFINDIQLDHGHDLVQTACEQLNETLALLDHVAAANDGDSLILHRVLGAGEMLSSRLVTAFLQGQGRQVAWLDASQVIVVEDDVTDVSINWNDSVSLISQSVSEWPDVDLMVVPGFVATNRSGNPVILGMNSSDYSAAIIAQLFQSPSLTIWTDVSGVMSADPDKVPSAFVLSQMSYLEALELAYFGSSVLHPLVIPIVKRMGIPLLIKNSFEIEQSGTLIGASDNSLALPVKGLTSIDRVALVNIEGAGMIGVSGIAARVFTALMQCEISVIFITQASSEYSISLAVKPSDGQAACDALSEVFAVELKNRHIERLSCLDDVAMIAAIGDGMVGRVGVSATLFSALAHAGINVRAIAQGSSERNLSVLISCHDLSRALRLIHSAYHLSNKTIAIGFVGLGTVGREFLQQLANEQQALTDLFGVNLKLCGLINSKKMMLDGHGVVFEQAESILSNSELPANMALFVDHMARTGFPHAVIIDCTANADVTTYYSQAIAQHVHIITPNKLFNSGDIQSLQTLKRQLKANNTHYLYETTVGAGLPIIHTLQDMVNTGDKIFSITGVFSGTLAFLFCQLNKGMTFSQAIKQAHERGYTEPDPREDLSGRDVARKVVCLAREIGLSVSMEDLEMDSLVPDALLDCSVDTFFEALPQYDQEMAKRIQEKQGEGAGVHYVGDLQTNGRVTVGLYSYPAEHVLSGLQETDNMVVIHSEHYKDRPLVIQGPGAGPQVTAAGVFADFLRLTSMLS